MMTLDTRLWLLLPASLAALGVGLLALSLGHAAIQLYHARTRRRLWQDRRAAPAATVEEVYHIPPLLPWIVLGAVVGWLLGQVLLSGPARNLGVLGGVLPLLWKQQRLREGRQQVQQEVAELVEALRLYLAFAPTPGAALRLVIQEAPAGILWDQLRGQLDTVRVEGPEAALTHVAETLEIPALRRLVARVRASQAGSTGLTRALQLAADELSQDLRREVEEEIEATPTRLLVPMLVMLMVPLLIVVLTPPVQTLLATLTGVGPTPLGR